MTNATYSFLYITTSNHYISYMYKYNKQTSIIKHTMLSSYTRVIYTSFDEKGINELLLNKIKVFVVFG